VSVEIESEWQSNRRLEGGKKFAEIGDMMHTNIAPPGPNEIEKNTFYKICDESATLEDF